MKLLLLLTSFSISAVVSAQNFQPDIDKMVSKSKFRDLLNIETIDVKAAPFELGKNPEPGVYSLPQDNMPCIVPDTKELAAMPNAFKRKEEKKKEKLGQMPNAMPEWPLLRKREPSK
jgi:hypothetical protein